MTAIQAQPQGRQRQVGKVYASITITNHEDEIAARRGYIDASEVRSLTLDRILIDTGANSLCLPGSLVQQLGLPGLKEVVVATASGFSTMTIHEDARISLLGRTGVYECLSLPEDAEPLLGVIPLEGMGFEPDLQNETLRVLPDSTKETYITAY